LRTSVDDQGPSKAAVFGASMSLLLFSALTTVALIGWFHHNPAPWNWKSVLAMGCAGLGVTTSALVWRAPSRGHAIMGILVMLASLARIGPPAEWTWVSFTLVAATFVLLMPLVHAAIVMRSE
jgi:hypothetical protein